MIRAWARTVAGPREPFESIAIERRDLGPRDVFIEIAYAGECHTDVHQLTCGSMTMDPPLGRWQAGPGKRVGIVEFCGLGHIAHALGAHTRVLTNTADRADDAHALGDDDYRHTTAPATFADFAESFALSVSTVPVSVDDNGHCGLLGFQDVPVNIGLPEKAAKRRAVLPAYQPVHDRGPMSGAMETQKIVDFCAHHSFGARVELIAANQLDVAFDRLTAGDVGYRFVFDTTTITGN